MKKNKTFQRYERSNILRSSTHLEIFSFDTQFISQDCSVERLDITEEFLLRNIANRIESSSLERVSQDVSRCKGIWYSHGLNNMRQRLVDVPELLERKTHLVSNPNFIFSRRPLMISLEISPHTLRLNRSVISLSLSISIPLTPQLVSSHPRPQIGFQR